MVRKGWGQSQRPIPPLLHRPILSWLYLCIHPERCLMTLDVTKVVTKVITIDPPSDVKRARSNRPRGAPRRSKRGKDDSTIFVR